MPDLRPSTHGPRAASRARCRKALLKVGYGCNNNCVFCHAAPHRGSRSGPGVLERKIRRAAALGAGMVVLSGGEPTVHPGWLDLVDRIADAGMRLGLVTNGRMLSYAGLVERLAGRRLEYAYLSLLGPDRELHDRHAGAPSFEQTLAALEILAARIPEVTANVVVTRWNIGRLRDFARTIAHLPAVRLKFSAIEPAGNALDDFDGLVPGLTETARAILAAVEHARRELPGRTVVWDGLPLCLAGRHGDLECGLREDDFAFMSEAFEKDWSPIDDSHRDFGPPCPACSLRRRCRGVFGEYLARRGASELRPVSREVANSFNWAPAGPEEKLSLRTCPVRAGRRPPPDPIRGIFVQTRPGRVRRHEAPTRDFSDETLRVATREEEQVYRDLGTAPLLTDFAQELRRLRLSAACRSCPARPLCGGVFVPARGSSFRLARSLLSRFLRRLSGTVLDVGCGLAPYREDLEPALRKGTLRYVGLDPREAPGPAAGPGVGFVRGSLERFRWRGPPFDTVMALRSLNHVPRAGRAVEKMAGLTAPGGTVVLAEDVVFGTLRPPHRLERILRRDDLPFEHHGNMTIGEAAAVAAAAGLGETARLTPSQTGSTLWILILSNARALAATGRGRPASPRLRRVRLLSPQSVSRNRW